MEAIYIFYSSNISFLELTQEGIAILSQSLFLFSDSLEKYFILMGFINFFLSLYLSLLMGLQQNKEWASFKLDRMAVLSPCTKKNSWHNVYNLCLHLQSIPNIKFRRKMKKRFLFGLRITGFIDVQKSMSSLESQG